MKMLESTPHDFVDFLEAQGISRFYFVLDAERRRVVPSHEVLQPIAEFLEEDRRDFLDHEGLFFQVSRRHRVLQGAFVHRTVRGQAAGGVRYWSYLRMEDYLRDGLRLAVGMTRKNALAGLWWGGGKGVMARRPDVDRDDPEVRAALYREYGEFMTSLRGCYVTAEDVGTTVADMAHVFAATRFTTCIPPALGGSGNPSVPTARGVVCGMEAALEVLGDAGIAGKTFAVQGVGNVGGPLVEMLFEKGAARIVASDVDPKNVERLRRAHAGRDLEVVCVEIGDEAILGAECDVIAPCATGAILNPRTIPRIRARVVCGAANNQLEDGDRDDALLHERGVLYVPDFLVNRMGIVTCANEQYGHVNDDLLIEGHLGREWEYSIHRMTQAVLSTSRESGEPAGQVATRMADLLSLEEHPVMGHRGRRIIASLVVDGWQEDARGR